MTSPFSVIVPVFNEARGLRERAELLLSELPEGCEVIFVCNGCTDGSEEILHETAGDRALLLVTEKGKASALRLGEAYASLLPRFYVDSDVLVSGADLANLCSALTEGIELVSPRIVFDLKGASWGARQLNCFWLSLPHARESAYHHVLGVSARGRARWGAFPDVIADDLFIESLMAQEEKRVVADVLVTTSPPRRVWEWVRVRIRWRQGVNQLQEAGVLLPSSGAQYRATLRAALSPASFVQALLYICLVLLARIVARTSLFSSRSWYRDASSR